MSEETGKPDLVAMLDQLGTTLENTATVIGNYYQALVKSGVPEILAAELVRDFHKYWVTKQSP